MEKGVNKPSILIIDDAITNIRILESTLQSDYQIFFSLNALDGIESAIKNQPDLILLDVMMPEIDGYEACSLLKLDERTRNIPVIFITSRISEEDETRGFDVGAVDYVAKPFRPVVVKARVATHISLKRAIETLKFQNDELLEASRLKEDIDKIMRHDLKTPLNGIIGLPQLILEDGNLNQEQKDFLQMIEDAGYVMLNMINLSLDLFKMERGIYQFHPEQVNILPLIDKIIFENKSLIQPHKIRICIMLNGRSATPEDSFFISGENLLCYSMLANIIKNAIEASPEDETITVSLDNSVDQFSIKVHNSGAVPENIRDCFFEKYTTVGKLNGTGLGNYSAQLIAKTMGFNISMTTGDREGTVLEIKAFNSNAYIDNKMNYNEAVA